MKKVQSDIDIDFFNRDEILSIIPHVIASRNDHGELKKHNTGVYLQPIPENPIEHISNIDYEEAAERGYFKIDFLNVSAYKGVKNEEHINELLAQEPLWELLHEKEICDQLAHVNSYHTLLADLNPTSIEELAMVLALIRPAKKHLISECREKGFAAIKNEIWVKPTDGGYYFKHSHAVGYAHLIVMQLNLICQNINASSSGI